MSQARLRYQTYEFGNIDLHLCTLRDRQQYSDPEGVAEALGISSASWPIFGVVWPSSLVLAHFLKKRVFEEKSVLEVGCGIALNSLLLNKRGVDITASDYHPEVEAFLKRNLALNEDSEFPYVRADWSQENPALDKYDVIVGSDLLYEDEQVDLLAHFIVRHAQDVCEIIIVDPGRGRKNKFCKKMQDLGFDFEQSKPNNTQYLDEPFKGHVLRFWR